jgi:hypothetical protein
MINNPSNSWRSGSDDTLTYSMPKPLKWALSLAAELIIVKSLYMPAGGFVGKTLLNSMPFQPGTT